MDGLRVLVDATVGARGLGDISPTVAGDITDAVKNLRFASAMPGGYADCTFTLNGDWRKDIPHLSILRVVYHSTIVWEGQVEDVDLTGLLNTAVSAFGLRRQLEETSVKEVWRTTDIGRFRVTDWIAAGANLLDAGAGYTREIPAERPSVSIGQINQTDPTVRGIRFTSSGAAAGAAVGEAVELYAPGIAFTRIRGTATETGTGGTLRFAWSPDGSTWTLGTGATASGTFSETPANSPDRIRLVNVGIGAAATDTFQASALRLFGTSIDEDTTAGVYGGQVLQDLVALVAGLTAGEIDQGSDFAVDDLARWQRTSVLSVVEEIASYYQRDWAVWDGGRFDWKAQAPTTKISWAVSLKDADEAAIDTTLDGVARTVYVVYADPTGQAEQEASAASTSLANPYVANDRAKDLVVAPGFPMTAATAASLAARIAADTSTRLPARGTLKLPINLPVDHITDGHLIALTMRPGENISIYDLPVADTGLLQVERDGRRIFRIVSSLVDVDAGQVTLELEGQGRTIDSLLARLAGVTKAITG